MEVASSESSHMPGVVDVRHSGGYEHSGISA